MEFGKEVKRASALIGIAIGGVGVAGCDQGKNDVGSSVEHHEKRQVWDNLNSFPNVSAFCIGENGVYTTTRSGSFEVVPNDPNCHEGGVLYESNPK